VETMAQDALAVLDACHEESAHVVGHSLGGLIALQLARVQPRRVRSLSLLCTFADGRAVGPLSWHLVWYGLRSKLGTRAMRRRAFLHLILPRDLLRSHSPNELAEQYGHHFARDLADTPAITSRQLQAMRRTDLTAFLGELAFIPTLVMSASEDPIAPPRLGRAIADGIPGARFLEVPAASHALPLHNADWVNETLRSHLRSAETRAH
jgi:pimeloyl-ACP methyl ester carboxylesterase